MFIMLLIPLIPIIALITQNCVMLNNILMRKTDLIDSDASVVKSDETARLIAALQQVNSKYRVFNEEGQKVMGYESMIKCAFEATKRLIASKNMGHFVIFVICLIISHKIYILKYMKKCTKLTKFAIFL